MTNLSRPASTRNDQRDQALSRGCEGDTAAPLGWNGKAVPGLAPAAKQGSAHAARVVRAMLEGPPHPGPFVYKHAGNLATIGRKAAVADLNLVHFSGALAWRGLVHIFFLAGVRNRIAVMMQWAWAYITYRGGMRLITGPPTDLRLKPGPVTAVQEVVSASRTAVAGCTLSAHCIAGLSPQSWSFGH